jgi:type I restriction enzyme S subunit
VRPPTTIDTDLPAGWALARVEDYFDSWGGATPSTSEPTYWEGTIPWISSKDVKEWRISQGTEFVTDRALENTRLRECPPGTVLVVIRSGVLVHTLPISITDRTVVINQDIKAFVSPDSDLNEWLALALLAKASDILTANRKDGTCKGRTENVAPGGRKT